MYKIILLSLLIFVSRESYSSSWPPCFFYNIKCIEPEETIQIGDEFYIALTQLPLRWAVIGSGKTGVTSIIPVTDRLKEVLFDDIGWRSGQLEVKNYKIDLFEEKVTYSIKLGSHSRSITLKGFRVKVSMEIYAPKNIKTGENPIYLYLPYLEYTTTFLRKKKSISVIMDMSEDLIRRTRDDDLLPILPVGDNYYYVNMWQDFSHTKKPFNPRKFTMETAKVRVVDD